MKNKYRRSLSAASLILLFLLLTNVLAQPDDAAARINFKRGASAATVRGTAAKGGPDFYLVGARAGQKMTVKVTGKVSFGIDSPENSLTEDDGNEFWSAEELPVDGDYKIRVYSKGGAQNYALTVSIFFPDAQKTPQKFTTSGYFEGIEMGMESGDPGGMSVFLTESDGQLYALVMTAAGDFFTPVLVEAKASGKDLRAVEFALPEDNPYSGGAKYQGVVSAKGLTLKTDETPTVLKRECGNLSSDISLGGSGDYGGMEVFLTDAGGQWYALVTVAEGVLKKPVLVEAAVTGEDFDRIEFTLPGENGNRKFKGTISENSLTLDQGGTRTVLKSKCYK